MTMNTQQYLSLFHILYLKQHKNAKLAQTNGKKWYFTCVYATNLSICNYSKI